MPIYEYRCAACGHEIEVLQKLSEAPLTECPSCHKSELKKLLSAAGFQLKGSGWYVTDFRGGSKPAAKDKTGAKPAATAGDNGGASTGGSESGASADAKSADKPSTAGSSESKPAATTPSTPKSDS